MSVDALPERFVADKTLGRLARWLRVLGQDVLYGPHVSGRGLLEAARRERRFVLTRERSVLRGSDPPPGLLVAADRFRDQLREVVRACGLDPWARLFARCVRCNELLADVPRADVAAVVPEFVLASQERFRRCPRCRRVFWAATHLERVRRELVDMGFPRPLAARDENL